MPIVTVSVVTALLSLYCHLSSFKVVYSFQASELSSSSLLLKLELAPPASESDSASEWPRAESDSESFSSESLSSE